MSDLKSDLINLINQRTLNGYVEYFHENGNLESKGTSHNHKRIGHWEFYRPNGALRMKGTFNNEIKVGLWLESYTYYCTVVKTFTFYIK